MFLNIYSKFEFLASKFNVKENLNLHPDKCFKRYYILYYN